MRVVADAATVRLEIDGGGVAVVWDLDALEGVGRLEGRPFDLEPRLDPGRWELARILSAALEDGRLLAVAAMRPVGASGHGAERVAGALVRDRRAAVLDEVLLSVEYDAAGAARRVGLELYEAPDSLPLRVAGDRHAITGEGDVALHLRAEGVEGAGRLSVLRAR